MRFARTFVLAFLSFLLAYPASAQQTATSVQRDAQALSVLAQCTTAMGATGAVPTIYAQGTITPVNPISPTSTVVLKSIGTNRVRSEVGLGGNQQVFVVNSGRGYSLVSGQRKTLALQTTAYYRPEHLNAFGCVIDVARPSMNITYVGLETINSASAHHLLFQSSSADTLEQLISEFHVYIDSRTFRLVKTATWVFAPDAIENRSRWETYYDNYQSIGGVLIPLHISHFLSGTHFDDWNFSSVRTDVPISDSDFN